MGGINQQHIRVFHVNLTGRQRLFIQDLLSQLTAVAFHMRIAFALLKFVFDIFMTHTLLFEEEIALNTKIEQADY